MPTPAQIFGANLIRHYLESYTTGNWVDATGTLNATQVTAGFEPTLGTTVNGRRYLTFDGTDDYLVTGNAEVFSGGSYTIGCWVRAAVDVNVSSSIIVGRYSSGISWVLGGGPVAGRISHSEDLGTYAYSDTDICDGSWHRLVCTLGPTKGLCIYVDGVESSTTAAGVTTSGTSTASTAIGAAVDSTGLLASDYYAGDLANLFMATREATATEAAQLSAYLLDWLAPVPGMLARPAGVLPRQQPVRPQMMRAPFTPAAPAAPIYADIASARVLPRQQPVRPSTTVLAPYQPPVTTLPFSARVGVPVLPARPAPRPILTTEPIVFAAPPPAYSALSWEPPPPRAVRAVARGPLAPTYLLLVPIVPVVIATLRTTGQTLATRDTTGAVTARLTTTGQTRGTPS
jgi:hypothetical protein